MTQVTTQLKQSVAEDILSNQRLQSRLQLAFGKSYFTIRRWAQNNDVILTSFTALQIIAEETGLKTTELLNE